MCLIIPKSNTEFEENLRGLSSGSSVEAQRFIFSWNLKETSQDLLVWFLASVLVKLLDFLSNYQATLECISFAFRGSKQTEDRIYSNEPIRSLRF